MERDARSGPDACDLAENRFIGLSVKTARSIWFIGRRGFLASMGAGLFGTLFCRRGMCKQAPPGARAMFCKKIGE